MARTGVSIKVSDTVLGTTPQVNANSMLIVEGAVATTAQPGGVSFALDKPVLIHSVDELAGYNITQANNPAIYKQVSGFYQPTTGVNNTGTVLWLVGTGPVVWTDVTTFTNKLLGWVRSTVVNGFQFRPRNILISAEPTVGAGTGAWDLSGLNDAAEQLYAEGFSVVMVLGAPAIGSLVNAATALPDLSTSKAPFVGVVIVTDEVGTKADPPATIVGRVGGFMASLSVGTSIGDASLQSFDSSLYFVDWDAQNYTGTPCASVSTEVYNALGDKQYIFARTRPPKNGLWLNDGATANDPANALSTLEAGRTIASMVDDLRAFFTPYINNKIPVTTGGDIDPTYKQVVLDNARSSVITPYIESGDISDARLSLKALNDDMVGTRTWEVTLEILPAPTLRWINGYVFYVKSLS